MAKKKLMTYHPTTPTTPEYATDGKTVYFEAKSSQQAQELLQRIRQHTMTTTQIIHLIGGPGHGKTLCVKGGVSVLLYSGRQFEYRHQEMIVNGCSFLVGQHSPTPEQMSEVRETLYHLTRDARPPTDGRVQHTHPGLHDEWDSDRAAWAHENLDSVIKSRLT